MVAGVGSRQLGIGRARLLPSLGAAISLGWCSLGFAQSEPQPFAPDIDARPISATEAASNNVLRWQNKPQANSGDYASVQPTSGNSQQPIRAGWNITRVDPSVRPAQYASSDPFNDPFGDRKPKGEPELILQPTQAEAGIEELPAPRRFSPVRRAVPDEPMMTIARQPSGAARGLLPDGTPAMPPVGAPPSAKSTVPCDRVYNDRNCCEHETNCVAFRNRLLTDSIRNISLDITAPFDKDPDVTPEQNEAKRIDRLRLLEVREWRDRRGTVIGTGKMSDLVNGSVVLTDETGKETGRVAINELGEDSLCYVTAWWRLPAECPLGGLRNAERSWLASNFHYHASALCHKPLYFEDVQLERYGHTAGPFRQPILSAAHFVVHGLGLPYQMAINPPTECQYSLGYYRPGSCAPWMIQPFPLSLRGATAEVGAALGMAYLIP